MGMNTAAGKAAGKARSQPVALGVERLVFKFRPRYRR